MLLLCEISGLARCRFYCFQKALAVSGFWGDFGEPDGGFYGFKLAEEGALLGEIVSAPVGEEASGFGSNLPGIGIWIEAPFLDLDTELVDETGDGVLLIFAVVEEAGLCGFLLARLVDGGEMAEGRREWMWRWVGWPVSSNSQCEAGLEYGELRIGERKKSLFTGGSSQIQHVSRDLS